MLTNIESLYVIAVLSFFFAFGFMVLKQWSEYEDHRKVHADDDPASKAYRDANRFAVVPYLIIPLIFVAMSVIAGLFAVDYAASVGWLNGSEGIAIWCIIASVVIYAVADYGLVSKVGDAAYFRFIESKVFQTVVELRWEDLTADEQQAVMEGKSIKQIMKERKA